MATCVFAMCPSLCSSRRWHGQQSLLCGAWGRKIHCGLQCRAQTIFECFLLRIAYLGTDTPSSRAASAHCCPRCCYVCQLVRWDGVAVSCCHSLLENCSSMPRLFVVSWCHAEPASTPYQTNEACHVVGLGTLNTVVCTLCGWTWF